MRNLAELNLNEGGLPVTRAAPSEGIIREFERHFQLTLPADYLRFLRFSNGGHPELDLIQPIGRPGAAGWGVNRFYHLSDDKNSPSSLWRNTQEWRHVLGEGKFPFAGTGGGDVFVLDLTTSPPSVKGCVHEEGFRLVDIAPSFEAFIDALELDPDMI